MMRASRFRKVSRSSHSIAAFITFILLSFTGCFRDPDLNKVLCHSPKGNCPGDYVCKLAGGIGRCCKPDDLNCPIPALDASASEALGEVGYTPQTEAGSEVDGQKIDGTAMDGPALDGATGTTIDTPTPTIDATADAPLPPPDGVVDVSFYGESDSSLAAEAGSSEGGTLLKGQGEICGSGTECANGQCADGVCCDKACNGCSACTQKLTSKSDGTCAPVSNGIDPHGICGSSCSGSTLSTLVCNGSGTCASATSQPCPGGVQCASSTACMGAGCSSDSQCASGYRCSGTSCVLKKALGSTCGAGSECSGGNCVGSICCSTSSCPACQDCSGTGGTCTMTANSNGQSCGANMYCNAGTCGACTPNQSCSTGNMCEIGSTSCATGRSVCLKAGNKGSGTSCGNAQTCSGNTLTYATTCNDSGVCVAGGSTTCQYGCSGNSCQTLYPDGTACTANSQCQSGGCNINQLCAACGAQNQLCCVPGICNAGLACDGVGCTACGAEGHPCCPSPASPCNGANLVCNGGTCWALQPIGGSCTSGSLCQSGACDYTYTCVASCGNYGESCCAGGTCNDPSTLACNFSAHYCYNYHGGG